MNRLLAGALFPIQPIFFSLYPITIEIERALLSGGNRMPRKNEDSFSGVVRSIQRALVNFTRTLLSISALFLL